MKVAKFSAMSQPHLRYYVCVDDKFSNDPIMRDYYLLTEHLQDETNIDCDEFRFLEFIQPVGSLDMMTVGAFVVMNEAKPEYPDFDDGEYDD